MLLFHKCPAKFEYDNWSCNPEDSPTYLRNQTILSRCRTNRRGGSALQDYSRIAGERAQRAESGAGVAIAGGHRLLGQNLEDDREFQGHGHSRGVTAFQEGGRAVRGARQGRHEQAEPVAAD